MLTTERLATKDATATVGVKNLGATRKFYEGVLGLTPGDTREPTVVSYKTGNTAFLVYETPNGGTNKATSATWMVDAGDVEPIVQTLKAKGVTFEHYDMPNTKREGDIHVSGPMKMAWFKDPDGNILCVVGE